jgi:nucleotide-binding universal stress UspA family protein
MDIVVAVDGSEHGLDAVRYAAKLARSNPEMKLHLINVQPPLPSAASSFVSEDAVRSFHREEGEKALRGARALLAEQKLGYECHVAVGQPAEAIVAYARQKGCAGIVIGTRGLSALPGLLLGSVATRVLHIADVPVTLIPRKRAGIG